MFGIEKPGLLWEIVKRRLMSLQQAALVPPRDGRPKRVDELIYRMAAGIERIADAVVVSTCSANRLVVAAG